MNNELQPLMKRLGRIHALVVLPSVAALVYVVNLFLGLSWEQFRTLILPVLLPNIAIVSLTLPTLIQRRWLRQALAARDASERLRLLLEFPMRVALLQTGSRTAGAAIFCGIAVVWFGKPFGVLLPAVGMVGLFALLMQLQTFVPVEQAVLPLALEALRSGGRVTKHPESLLWVRQRWFLPFAFAATVCCTLGAFAAIVGVPLQHLLRQLSTEAAAGTLSASALHAAVLAFWNGLLFPTLFILVYLVAMTGAAAWMLANRQKVSAIALGHTLQRLAAGETAFPEWVAADETGDVAFGLVSVQDQLSSVSTGLQRVVGQLASTAEQLRSAADRQQKMLTQQASALQETQVTTQEIKQTSLLAQQKAQEVLNHTEEADQVRLAGGVAVDEGLRGLAEIKEQVLLVVSRVISLEDKARQIVSIADTVRDLSTRSNMLALNAAIEAARAGENGKGFAVVAREIRTLADQSIRETRRIHSVLQEVTDSIREVATASSDGQMRIEASLSQVRTTGDTLQTLSRIVETNSASARQIAAAVSQQASGIAQIFEAVGELSRMMGDTLSEVEQSERAIGQLHGVAEDVESRARRLTKAA